MLEDSDSEPSESEPLVQHQTVAPANKRDPEVWKSNSGKSAKAGSTSSTSAKNSRKDVAPQPPPATKTDVTSSPTSKPGTNKPIGDAPVRGGGVVTRNSSKRLQDLVSHLEQVPESDEVEGMAGVSAESVSKAKDGASFTEISRADEGSQGQEQSSPNEESSSLGCPFFGVRNYLHHFYDKPSVKDPSLYEDLLPYTSDEGVFLVKNSSTCSSPVFRLSVLLGGLILLMGAVALTVAACSTRRSPVVAKVGGVSVIDRQAATHNAEVDALVLVGMVAVVLGCSVLTAALLSRAFCFHSHESRPLRIRLLGGEVTPGVMSERLIPATEELTTVQPFWGSSSGYTSVKGVLMMP